MKVFLAFASSFVLLTGSSSAALIADFASDYSDTTQGVNNGFGSWEYLWNQPTGWTGGALTGAALGDLTTAPLSDTTSFAQLQATSFRWTPDGNDTGGDSNPDRFLSFQFPNPTTIGVHPGAQAGFNVGAPGDANGVQANAFDRYAIAAFTVDNPGIYQITDGVLWTGSATSDGVDVWAFATGQTPTLLGNSTGGSDAASAFNFTHTVGGLNAGDTIYVAFGTNGSAGSDGSRANFSILAIPEPSAAPVLLLIAAAALAARRSRRSPSQVASHT